MAGEVGERYYADRGHITDDQESHEEKSRLHTLEKKGLKTFEEDLDMMKIISTKGC